VVIADGGIVEAIADRHEHDLGLAHDLKVLSRRRIGQHIAEWRSTEWAAASASGELSLDADFSCG
jgi:hypothetical protein